VCIITGPGECVLHVKAIEHTVVSSRLPLGILLPPNQHSLWCCRCMQLTPRGIISVADNCRQLRELYLYACSQVTDACLVAVGKLRELRLISLCGGTLLTGACFLTRLTPPPPPRALGIEGVWYDRRRINWAACTDFVRLVVHWPLVVTCIMQYLT